MSNMPEINKRELNFIYVDGETSNFSPVRGKAALQSFSSNWSHLADVKPVFTNYKTFGLIDTTNFNIIWLDNVRDIFSARHVQSIREKNPNTRIVYALDDFIWEGIAGRAVRLNECRTIEMLIDIADTLVVNNGTIVDLIKKMGLIGDDKEVLIIPTPITDDLFSTFKTHRKVAIPNKDSINKPKVLIKGTNIPKNVQTFITVNYTSFDITISSVGELSPSVIKLLETNKIKHIMHWSNPDITHKTNIAMYARERDMQFDFVLLTKPDDLSSDYYELTMGDEDVVFAIANGSIPVCGIDHIGYDEDSIFYASGLTFGPETTPKQIFDLLKENSKIDKWNRVIYDTINYIRPRISNSPETLRMYYSAMIGIEEFNKESELIRNHIEKIKASNDEIEEPLPDNVIEGKFGE